MTVGTGFFGRSSLTENLEPRHLVQWTRMAYNSEADEAFGNFSGLSPWEAPAGPVPPYPIASNAGQGERGPGGYLGADRTPPPATPLPHVTGGARLGAAADMAALREEIRRVVIEELAQFAGGSHG